MVSKMRGKGEGSISQRHNGTWRAQTSTRNGKPISSSFKTKVEAQTWLRNMQIQLDQGYDYHGGTISLAEYLPVWLEASKTALREKTAHQYDSIIRKHIIPGIGTIRLNDLRLARIEQFYSELIQSSVGVRSIRIIHSVLHRSLNKAIQYGLVVKNPAHGAALPKYRHAEMQVLDESQVSRFLVAAQGSRYEALYYLAITTGMRQGELFGLQWSDLHWNNGMLYVQRQSQRVAGKGWWFEEPKTKAGRRPVMVGEVTLQKLREHLERQPLQKAVTGSRWQENNLIFPSTIGTPGDPSNLRVDFRKVLEKAGLPMIRFHDLRHTAASIMLNNNIPVITVSKRLGHAKPSTTLDIYGHLYPESQEEAARIMDEIITPIPLQLLKSPESEKTDQIIADRSTPIYTDLHHEKKNLPFKQVRPPSCGGVTSDNPHI